MGEIDLLIRDKLMERGFSKTVIDMVEACEPVAAKLWANKLLQMSKDAVARMNYTANAVDKELKNEVQPL